MITFIKKHFYKFQIALCRLGGTWAYHKWLCAKSDYENHKYDKIIDLFYDEQYYLDYKLKQMEEA